MEEPTNPSLFNYVVIVGLNGNIGNKAHPIIVHSYPQLTHDKSQTMFLNLPQFCFPESIVRDYTREQFSFILTAENGKRMYGYCLRSNYSKGSALAYCALCERPVFSISKQVLFVVETRYTINGWQCVKAFLEALSTSKLPKPGETLKITCSSLKSSNVSEMYCFLRPEDSERYLDNVDLPHFLGKLTDINLLSIFASLLCERRIIFSSSSVSDLSNCVQSCITLLYPFSWQYVLVPVLPSDLITVCCAPMPFILGISSQDLPKVLTFAEKGEVEDVIVYDLDSQEFLLNPQNDHNEYIDIQTQSQMRHSISFNDPHRGHIWKKIIGTSPVPNKELNTKIADIFLGFMLRLLSNYNSFMVVDKGTKSFKINEFIIQFKGTHLEKLSNKLKETQLFHSFIVNAEKDKFENTSFAKKLKMLNQLRLGLTKEITEPQRQVLHTAIDEILGVVPSKMQQVMKLINHGNQSIY